MNATVFLTVLTGFVTFVLGQLAVKLVIEPVKEMRRTIGKVAHSHIERANVVANPGVLPDDVMNETSKHLRALSSELQSHLYLVPWYGVTAKVFRLPAMESILKASSYLIGLSNSVYRASDNVYEANAKRSEAIHDLLGLYMEEGQRWPKDLK